MKTPDIRLALLPIVPVLALVLVLVGADASDGGPTRFDESTATTLTEKESAMQVEYLEIVTPDVDATCAMFEKIHGVAFAKADPAIGNARTADLKNGGRIGVRAPMHDAETPVVRPYLRVKDAEAAVASATEAGAEIMMGVTEIPGEGKFAIFMLGGIQHAVWQR